MLTEVSFAGCAGPSLLAAGPLPGCGGRGGAGSRCAGSARVAQVPHGTWGSPGPGTGPVSLALAGGFLTTGPQGSPRRAFSFRAAQFPPLLPELLESHVGRQRRAQRCGTQSAAVPPRFGSLIHCALFLVYRLREGLTAPCAVGPCSPGSLGGKLVRSLAEWSGALARHLLTRPYSLAGVCGNVAPSLLSGDVPENAGPSRQGLCCCSCSRCAPVPGRAVGSPPQAPGGRRLVRSAGLAPRSPGAAPSLAGAPVCAEACGPQAGRGRGALLRQAGRRALHHRPCPCCRPRSSGPQPRGLCRPRGFPLQGAPGAGRPSGAGSTLGLPSTARPACFCRVLCTWPRSPGASHVGLQPQLPAACQRGA